MSWIRFKILRVGKPDETVSTLRHVERADARELPVLCFEICVSIDGDRMGQCEVAIGQRPILDVDASYAGHRTRKNACRGKKSHNFFHGNSSRFKT